MALGVPDRLRPRIFLTFGTTRVVGRQPKAPAAFTPGEIPGTYFQRLSRPHGFVGRNHGNKSQVTPPGIDTGTVRLVAQHLNHYATPGPDNYVLSLENLKCIKAAESVLQSLFSCFMLAGGIAYLSLTCCTATG